MGISVAVVGATGNVGREILNILSDRQFPLSRIAAVASRKSVGSEISFGDELLMLMRIFESNSGRENHIKVLRVLIFFANSCPKRACLNNVILKRT